MTDWRQEVTVVCKEGVTVKSRASIVAIFTLYR